MATTATPTLTLQARNAGKFFAGLDMTDEVQFLAHFGRAVERGCTPVTAAMLERADGLIRIAEADKANAEAVAA